MSGMYIESEADDDKAMVHKAGTSHMISYMRRKGNTREVRVMWVQ
jgi:hypothetical protein